MTATRVFRVIVGLSALLIAWLTVSVTLANAAADRVPQLALRLWPAHAVAHMRLADGILARQPNRRTSQAAARQAAAALRRDPTLAGAVRILALNEALHNRPRAADRLFDYSVFLSRRDAATQFWLIERSVQRNDVTGALSHFEIALRVAPGSGSVLFPVLNSALSAPHLFAPIAGLAYRNDSWRPEFLYYVAAHGSPDVAARLYVYVARRGKPATAEQTRGLLERLVQRGRLAAAAQLYRMVDPHWAQDDLTRQLDGSFSRTNDLAPFGWAFNEAVAWRSARPGAPGNLTLTINIPESGEDMAVRRLLVLPSGRYRLSGRYGLVDPASSRISFAFQCELGSQDATSFAIQPNRSSGHFQGELRLPATCSQAWLVIRAGRTGSGFGGSLWVDDLSLNRIGASI